MTLLHRVGSQAYRVTREILPLLMVDLKNPLIRILGDASHLNIFLAHIQVQTIPRSSHARVAEHKGRTLISLGLQQLFLITFIHLRELTCSNHVRAMICQVSIVAQFVFVQCEEETKSQWKI